jgi:hypothetical protein
LLPGEAIIGRLLHEAFARPDDAVGFRKPPVDVGLPLRDLEPLSTNKLRGIVTIKVQAGAT